MQKTVVLGSQWGDEGKGKVIDVLSETADFVIRFNGGNNAGHTVINDYGKFPMRLIPSGVFAKKAIACIGNGVVIDPEVLVNEMQMLQKSGINLKDKLFISPRCHVILPYHKILDGLYEASKGKGKTGTTGRGIGPVYADKVSYNGIRLYDFLNKKQFSEKLEVQLKIKNKIIKALGGKPLKQSEIEKALDPLRKKLAPYIKELYPILNSALKKKKHILLEGAHAVLLDNDWGTYPFVTASSTFPGAINIATGMPQTTFNTIGVVKAYTTRVGAGPFPTELNDKTGETLRKMGNEFGTTTGRPRRCGWFDAELVRFSAGITGFSSIALTKVDVLDDFEEIKICTGYKIKDKEVNYYDGDALFLEKVRPVYKTIKGWKQSTQGITNYNDLPTNAKKYIKEIEKQVGVKVKYISTGPERSSMIVR